MQCLIHADPSMQIHVDSCSTCKLVATDGKLGQTGGKLGVVEANLTVANLLKLAQTCSNLLKLALLTTKLTITQLNLTKLSPGLVQVSRAQT